MINVSNNLTPHINAAPDDFAQTVLMPGDPLRAKFIAENMLDDAKLINSVRGMNGYTGFYKGKKVSVMASGTGMPSMGIYSYELYKVFGVENIIRIGTAGAINKDLKLRDIVVAMGASTDSNFALQYDLPGNFSAVASFELLKKAAEQAEKNGSKFHVGNVLTTDVFYNDNETNTEKWAKMGIMCVEMETAALYMTAARLNKKALAVLTISDNIITGEQTTAQERQTTFENMISIALETAIKI